MPELRPKLIADFVKPFRVQPGRRVRLPKDFDPALETRRASDKQAKEILQQGVALLSDYQERLAAQATTGVVVVLQAMDAAGKDGTIRHVMSGVNPQGVAVQSFKVPSSTELEHDYLWRYARALPSRGRIGIFNRSYYEEVLVVRVHPAILQNQRLPAGPRGSSFWKQRFQEINNWEWYLTNQGFRVVKLFLNVSREEQRRRFLARIDLQEKNWKFSANDVKERAYWDEYQRAFGDVLSNTSTSWAPWYVVPADRKSYARVVAAAIIANALHDIDPQFPDVGSDQLKALAAARIDLLAQAPKGVPADPFAEEMRRKAELKAARKVAGVDGKGKGRHHKGRDEEAAETAGVATAGTAASTDGRAPAAAARRASTPRRTGATRVTTARGTSARGTTTTRAATATNTNGTQRHARTAR